jgi:hypothetical protein
MRLNDYWNKAQILRKDVDWTKDGEVNQDFVLQVLASVLVAETKVLNYAKLFIRLFNYFKELTYRKFFPFGV